MNELDAVENRNRQKISSLLSRLNQLKREGYDACLQCLEEIKSEVHSEDFGTIDELYQFYKGFEHADEATNWHIKILEKGIDVARMSFQQLSVYQKHLQIEIERKKLDRYAEGKAKIQAIADEYGIEVNFNESTIQQLVQQVDKPKRTAKKYKNPETGIVWDGWGPLPKWLKDKVAEGQDKSEFLFNDE